MTEHLSVDQSVSLGGAAVAIILPSPDQTQPDTEDRGLEKFMAPSFILFFENLSQIYDNLDLVYPTFHVKIILSVSIYFQIRQKLFIFCCKIAAHMLVVVCLHPSNLF